MRRFYPVLMMTLLLLLLCACQAKEQRQAEKILAYHASAEKSAWSGVLRVDYGDRVLDFGLNCSAEGGVMQIEVTSPEVLRGVKAVSEPGKTMLEYDGMILETGELPGTGLSPLEILPFMREQWSGGYVAHESRETLKGADCTRLTFTLGNLELATWFGASNEPMLCELMADGVLQARLTIENFTVG